MQEVPTKKIFIGEGKDKIEVEVRKFLTQEQEDQHQSILMGDQDIDVDVNDKKDSGSEKMTIKVNMSNTNAARKYLVETMLVSHKWEDFNVWEPVLREDLLKQIEILRGIEKKSSGGKNS